MADTYFAWSTIYNGGESDVIETQFGRRRVVKKRNIIQPGEKVSKASLKVEDDVWDNLVATGSVRDYPFPDIPDTFLGSPSDFIMSKLRKGEEDIDQDLLMKLAMMSSVGPHPTLEAESEDVKTINEK